MTGEVLHAALRAALHRWAALWLCYVVLKCVVLCCAMLLLPCPAVTMPGGPHTRAQTSLLPPYSVCSIYDDDDHLPLPEERAAARVRLRCSPDASPAGPAAALGGAECLAGLGLHIL